MYREMLYEFEWMVKQAALNEDIELYPYQDRAVNKILAQDPEKLNSLILAHTVGSGKTLSSIAAFEKLKGEGRAAKALVVTPASLRENFAHQGVGKFTNSKFNILGNKTEAANRNLPHVSLDNLDPEADYNIVSYEMFKKDPEGYIGATGADTVIFDELHRSKDDLTKVYESIERTRPLYKNFIGLTGSIVSNRPHDIVPLINAATYNNNNIGTIDDFERAYIRRMPVQYGNPRKAPIIGIKNQDALRGELLKYVDYVDEEEVGTENKPRKTVHTVPVEMTKEQFEVYNSIMKKNPKMARKLQNMEELSDDEVKKLYNALIGARRVGNSMASFKRISLEEASNLTPKTKKLLDDLEDHIHNTPDGQAIVYSNLIDGGIDVLEAGLQSRNIPYGKFIGKGNKGVTEKQRQQDVDDYNAGLKKVMLISAAGGEGLNLKDTTMVLSADPHFNPEKINQVEARGVRTGGLSHRPQEEREVLVNRYVATLPETGFWVFKKRRASIDERIYEVAARKARTNQMLLDLLKEQQEVKTAMDDKTEVCQSCGVPREEKKQPHCKCGHDHTTTYKAYKESLNNKIAFKQMLADFEKIAQEWTPEELNQYSEDILKEAGMKDWIDKVKLMYLNHAPAIQEIMYDMSKDPLPDPISSTGYVLYQKNKDKIHGTLNNIKNTMLITEPTKIRQLSGKAPEPFNPQPVTNVKEVQPPLKKEAGLAGMALKGLGNVGLKVGKGLAGAATWGAKTTVSSPVGLAIAGGSIAMGAKPKDVAMDAMFPYRHEVTNTVKKMKEVSDKGIDADVFKPLN